MRLKEKLLGNFIDEMSMEDLKLTLDGGRSSGELGNLLFKFQDAASSNGRNDKRDLNSRANTQIKEKCSRSIEYFPQMHLDSEREHAFSVDENAVATHNYVHGEAHSVKYIYGRKR